MRRTSRCHGCSRGAVFSTKPDREGFYTLFVSGGFENKVWTFSFLPNTAKPIIPASDGPDTKVGARSIDVSGFAALPPDPRYNDGRAAVYPTGLALSPDGAQVAGSASSMIGKLDAVFKSGNATILRGGKEARRAGGMGAPSRKPLESCVTIARCSGMIVSTLSCFLVGS